MSDKKLHIERHMSYNGMNEYLISGLTPKDMDSILDSKTWDEQRNRLVKLLDEYDNDYQPGHTLGTCWGCGYGIYDIRHFGGHLIVETGSTCD